MPRFPLAIALLTLAACSETTTEKQTTTVATAPDTATTSSPAPAAPEPMDTLRAPGVTAQADTLQQVRKQHVFSAPGTPDEFRLVLRGKSLLTAQATFTITSGSDKRVIFRENFPVADLEAAMVYEMTTPTASPTEREAYVKKRLQEFFADKNFAQPAIGPRETYQPGTLDRASWEAVQKDAASIAFRYLLGKEDQRKIVWSPKQKQVVQVPMAGG